MHSRLVSRIGLVALVTSAIGGSGVAGCAQERDPINRVQLNAIPKSFLVGQKYDDPSDDPEFYARTMVIKVPYGESSSDALMFTNTVNAMAKIKWTIEEAMLVGRISFERINGTDGTGLAKPPVNGQPRAPLAQNDGQVVYQFRILGQFDVRRGYNGQTGEETNVVEENATDRPWTQRDYVRVDFSQNLNTSGYDFDTLGLLNVYNAIKYTPAQLDIRNPNDENAPVLDLGRGYFDVTNKVFAEPQKIDLGGGFVLPGCMLPNILRGGTAPWANCNPNEITLRHSFKRVVDTDYEPLDWDGIRFETYGAFFMERQGYARDYGLVDKKWNRFISRYNIWERSHAYANPEAMTGPVTCVVDDQCSAVGSLAGASHCDTTRNQCTLPYVDRKAKPVVWHYADKSPMEFFEPTREATEEWDAAMRMAVQTAKYAECKRYNPDPEADCGVVVKGNFAEEEDATFLVKEIEACRRGEIKGQDPKGCNALADSLGEKRQFSQAVRSIAKMSPMVILCHSPVAQQDPEVCGTKGAVARLGDLRFHLVSAIATPETQSPWGIMSDSNDPLTGEHIAASINVWTHVNDLWSRGIIDQLRYIAGELKTADVTEGKNVADWVEAARLAKGSAMYPSMSRDEVDKRIAAVGGSSLDKFRKFEAQRSLATSKAGNVSPIPTRLEAALQANVRRVQNTFAAADAPSTMAPVYAARANLAKGTPLEAAAMTPAMQQLAGAGYGALAAAPDMQANVSSILRGLNPTFLRNLEKTREISLARRGACIMNVEALAPLGYLGLSDVMQEKFGAFNPGDDGNVQDQRAERMQNWLARRAHFSVISHEMGHSFGLRHNFVSSSDAWNFRPQYWQLRTNDKKVSKTTCPAEGTANGASCVGPRWTDPVTANEQKNLIHMFMHSSTMEYAGEPTQDTLGLGAYDHGATRMFYANTVAVYDEDRMKRNGAAGSLALGHQNDFGGLLGLRYGSSARPTHYSALDGAADLIQNCRDIVADDFRPAHWDESKNGVWHPVMDGHIVSNEQGVTTKCGQPNVDFVQWEQLQNAAQTRNTQAKTHAYDALNRVRVPHGFASDEWADLGNVAVYRHDNGADLYEQMHFWIAQQEMTHIFANYRRGKRDFSIWGAFQRTQTRYHEKMRDAAKGLALYVNLAKDTISEYGDETTDDPAGFVTSVLKEVGTDSVVASSIAFDYFAHVFARPQPGEHGRINGADPVLRSFDSTAFASGGAPELSVANGVTGGFGLISLGGRPIQNELADNQGRDYNRDYTINVGSYYEKAYTASLFTESADNFISSSRDDFVDPRFRSVSMADVFPDGFRRWLGNNLTGDDSIKGVYTAGANGVATLDKQGFAQLGMTSWWPKDGIEICFPTNKPLHCREAFDEANLRTTAGPAIDPQVGWEQQKFAILFTLLYLPENAKQTWLEQMAIYEMGKDNDPGFTNRIEFHDPTGRVFVARTFGTETLMGKTVQRGIGARMLEYANELLTKSVQATPVTMNGVTWHVPQLGADKKVVFLNDGKVVSSCENSRECTKLKNYVSIPILMRDTIMQFHSKANVGDMKGVYN